MLLTISDAEHMSAYLYGASGLEDIRPKEYTQFILQSRVLFVAFENQYYQYCNGSLDEETYKGYERTISNQILAFRGFCMYWELNREMSSPIFAKHVDSMIANTPEIAPDKMLKDWQRLARDWAGIEIANEE